MTIIISQFKRSKLNRCWKIGKVTPLFKKGNRQVASNYRSITLLKICSKMFEKCIFNALCPFVAPLIYHRQYGFQRKKSTVLQLIAYLKDIYKGIHQKETVVEAVYLDFAKASDKLNHSILLDKLPKIGIGGKLLKIIRSYLSNRRQFVNLDGTESSLIIYLFYLVFLRVPSWARCCSWFMSKICLMEF